jgi:hypothetical protein
MEEKEDKWQINMYDLRGTCMICPLQMIAWYS